MTPSHDSSENESRGGPAGSGESSDARTSHLHELVRRGAEGRLSADERAELERAQEHDPALRDFASDYAFVHRATGLLEAVSLEEGRFEGALEAGPVGSGTERAQAGTSHRSLRSPVRALVLIAATLLVAFLVLRRSPPSVPVLRLQALRPVPSLGALAGAGGTNLASIRTMTHYRSVEAGAVRWLTDPVEAKDVARLSQRARLFYAGWTGCPFCEELEREVFPAPGVLDLLEDFVPQRVALDELAPERVRELIATGYPVLFVLDAQDQLLHDFSGMHSALEFAAELERGLERADPRRVLDWAECQELARYLEEAAAARSEEREGEALALFQTVLDVRATGPFRELGENGVLDVARDAWARFEDLRALSESDRAAAAERAAAERQRFLGTPFAHDFESLHAAFAADAPLPRVELLPDA